MKHRLIGPLAVLVFLFMNTPAYAYFVSTTAGDFDVTTTTGSFNALADLLDDQVWWGNVPLALEFARAVNTNLGLPNEGGLGGPIFADAGVVGISARGVIWHTPTGDATSFGTGDTSEHVWATATEVTASLPEPGTLSFLVIGFAGIAWVRLRRKIA